MVSRPDARQFVRKNDLAALMEEDDKRRVAEPDATLLDDETIEHAREMPAAVRNRTHAAALDVQPDPNEADLTLGHLQGLINPLTDLLKARGTRPLSKLTITRSKTKPGIGDEEYLEKDIQRIGEFMETEKYKQLNASVKGRIATYLREQKATLQHLASEAADSEVDRTEVIRPAPRPDKEQPQEGRLAKFLKRFGL